MTSFHDREILRRSMGATWEAKRLSMEQDFARKEQELREEQAPVEPMGNQWGYDPELVTHDWLEILVIQLYNMLHINGGFLIPENHPWITHGPFVSICPLPCLMEGIALLNSPWSSGLLAGTRAATLLEQRRFVVPSGYVKIAIENGHRNSGFYH